MIRLPLALAALAAPVAVMAAAPMTGATYIAKAGASDAYEEQSSALVKNSSNQQVAQFAQQMITDHTKSTQDVKTAARQAGLKVAPPKLDAMQTKMIADLKKVSGSQRDMLYITQQKKAHQMALALHQGYAANGSVAPLKNVAGTIAPVVQSHIDMLNGMPMGSMSGM